jgi:HAD superfamily hydrolase (TIGR01662 family)
LKGGLYVIIKGVLFDFGGTIVQGDLKKQVFRQSLYNYIRELGFDDTESCFRKTKRRMFEELMQVRSLNREMRLEDLYQGLFFRLGLHPTQEAIDYIHDLYIRSFNVELVNDVKKVLEYLFEKYKLAIVSNSMSNVARHAIRKFNLEKYFDIVVISRDLGIRKPNPEIFNYTLNNIGLDAQETVHIGDSLEEDVCGAQNAGLKTIWIKKTDANKNIQPDYTVNSVKELTTLL